MAYSGNPKDYSVAVVYGGTSGEREVSLNSGVACADALKEAGFAVDLVDPSVKEDLKKLIDGNYDIAFLALHGKGGEDGTIQGFLETVGIPYTGSGILASAQAVNKGKAKELYAAAGLKMCIRDRCLRLCARCLSGPPCSRFNSIVLPFPQFLAPAAAMFPRARNTGSRRFDVSACAREAGSP